MSELFDNYASGPVTVAPLDDHVVLVTLNRPDARNAINPEVTATLDTIVSKIEADPDIWVVVLTGSGNKVFSAGADLKEVGQGRIEALYSERGGFAGLTHARRSKVWIAAVNGFALAGGFEIVLSCDLVVASDNAVFGLPEVGVGLVAAAGGAYRLPQRIPRAVAMEFIFTGDRLDVDRALELGLVNRVVPLADVVDEAGKLAGRICANAPLAVRESLNIASKACDLDDESLDRLSWEAQKRLSRTDDFQEGPRAFVEKRAPVWKGC